MGFPNDQAKDMVQGFFTEKVFSQELIERADRNRGKFRNLLLVAMRNYVINLQKKRHLPIVEYRDAHISKLDSPERAFDRAYGEQVLSAALKALQEECRKRGRIGHWHLFQEWLVEPQVEGEGDTMSELCAKYGFSNPAQAYKSVFKMKARFRTILRKSLQSLAEDEDGIDVEIERFISIFSKS